MYTVEVHKTRLEGEGRTSAYRVYRTSDPEDPVLTAWVNRGRVVQLVVLRDEDGQVMHSANMNARTAVSVLRDPTRFTGKMFGQVVSE